MERRILFITDCLFLQDGMKKRIYEFCLLYPQVGKGGLEPPRLATPDPKSGPSANSGTPPGGRQQMLARNRGLCPQRERQTGKMETLPPGRLICPKAESD